MMQCTRQDGLSVVESAIELAKSVFTGGEPAHDYQRSETIEVVDYDGSVTLVHVVRSINYDVKTVEPTLVSKATRQEPRYAYGEDDDVIRETDRVLDTVESIGVVVMCLAVISMIWWLFR